VSRRRAAMAEAGLEHAVAAQLITDRTGIPTSRESVTNVVNGHFTSERIAAELTTLLAEAFRQLKLPARARQMTPSYLGWRTGDPLANLPDPASLTSLTLPDQEPDE
jgi:hypothetical protein